MAHRIFWLKFFFSELDLKPIFLQNYLVRKKFKIKVKENERNLLID
jgi:hypothetical protein